jgi:hypothetical protein
MAKRWAKAANLKIETRDIAAHSLRRGGITSMFRNGAKLEEIMQQSRHRTPAIAMGYIENQKVALNPAIRALGLR